MDTKKFIEEIKSLSVLELNELVHAIEEEFGVSAAAPIAVAGGAAAAAPAVEEKTEFDVVLKALPQPSRKLNPRKPPKVWLKLLPKPAQKRKLSNYFNNQKNSRNITRVFLLKYYCFL